MKIKTACVIALISVAACRAEALTNLEKAAAYKAELMRDAVVTVGLYQRCQADISAVTTPPKALPADPLAATALVKSLAGCFNAPLEPNNEYRPMTISLTRDASASEIGNWNADPAVEPYYRSTLKALFPCPPGLTARYQDQIKSLPDIEQDEMQQKLDLTDALRVHLKYTLPPALPPLIARLQTCPATLEAWRQAQAQQVAVLQKNPYAAAGDKQNAQQALDKISAVKSQMSAFCSATLPAVAPLTLEVEAQINGLPDAIARSWRPGK